MKIVLEDMAPGELEEKAEHIMQVIAQLAGGQVLQKAKGKAEPHPDEKPRTLEIKALEQACAQAKKRHVERIRAVMEKKLIAALGS